MQLDRFTKTAIFISMLLVASIAVLGILAQNRRLHVRFVERVETDGQPAIQDQRIRVVFSRPLVDEDVSTYVSVSPAAKHKSIVQGSSLYVIFDQNLMSDTAYTLKIEPGIQGLYEDELENSFEYEFHTRPLSLLYLAPGELGGSDRIMRATPQLTDEEVLFTYTDIQDYTKSGDYLALIVESEVGRQDLLLVNLPTKETQKLTSEHQSVYQMAFSPVSNELIILMENVKREEGFIVSDGGRGISIYNISKQEFYPLELGITVEDMDEFTLSADGNAIVFKDTFNAQYHLASIPNPEQVAGLGTFVGTGGFSPNSQEAIFTELHPLSTTGNTFIKIVNSQGEDRQLTTDADFSIDPKFLNTSGLVVFSQQYREVDGSKGLFQLLLTDDQGTVISEIQSADNSLELPNPSPDDRFIVMEQYTQEQLIDYDNLRVLGFQAKPSTANIRVYDTESQTLLEPSLKGIIPRWD